MTVYLPFYQINVQVPFSVSLDLHSSHADGTKKPQLLNSVSMDPCTMKETEIIVTRLMESEGLYESEGYWHGELPYLVGYTVVRKIKGKIYEFVIGKGPRFMIREFRGEKETKWEGKSCSAVCKKVTSDRGWDDQSGFYWFGFENDIIVQVLKETVDSLRGKRKLFHQYDAQWWHRVLKKEMKQTKSDIEELEENLKKYLIAKDDLHAKESKSGYEQFENSIPGIGDIKRKISFDNSQDSKHITHPKTSVASNPDETSLPSFQSEENRTSQNQIQGKRKLDQSYPQKMRKLSHHSQLVKLFDDLEETPVKSKKRSGGPETEKQLTIPSSPELFVSSPSGQTETDSDRNDGSIGDNSIELTQSPLPDSPLFQTSSLKLENLELHPIHSINQDNVLLLMHKVPVHTNHSIQNFAISPGKQLTMLVSSQEEILFYHYGTNSYTLSHRYSYDNEIYHRVLFTPDGSHGIFHGSDGSGDFVRFFNFQSNSEKTLIRSKSPIISLVILNVYTDTECFLICSKQNGSVTRYDISPEWNKVLNECNFSLKQNEKPIIHCLCGGLEDMQHLVFGNSNHSLFVWNLKDGTLVVERHVEQELTLQSHRHLKTSQKGIFLLMSFKKKDDFDHTRIGLFYLSDSGLKKNFEYEVDDEIKQTQPKYSNESFQNAVTYSHIGSEGPNGWSCYITIGTKSGKVLVFNGSSGQCVGILLDFLQHPCLEDPRCTFVDFHHDLPILCASNGKFICIYGQPSSGCDTRLSDEPESHLSMNENRHDDNTADIATIESTF